MALFCGMVALRRAQGRWGTLAAVLVPLIVLGGVALMTLHLLGFSAAYIGVLFG